MSQKWVKKYLGVQSEINGQYISLSMGAGEQRVFKILGAILESPKYSLILIDEIDLLLHVNALKRLLIVLSQMANAKNLQIIFTTHSLVVNEMTDYLKIRYITQTSSRTEVKHYIGPNSFMSLTGARTSLLNVFVEDELSKTIVEKILHDHQMKRYTDVKKFGPGVNGFTLLCGLALDGKLSDREIVVFDGDIYKTDEIKMEQIKKVLTGQSFDDLRSTVLDSIFQFNLPENTKPEKWIHKIITNMPEQYRGDEVYIALNGTLNVYDDHDYLKGAIEKLGYNYQAGLIKIVDLAAESDEWDEYVGSITEWVIEKKKLLCD